jgi:hypothetical protein
MQKAFMALESAEVAQIPRWVPVPGRGNSRGGEDLGYETAEVGQPVGLGMEDDDGDRQRGQVLLKGKIAIDGDKDVEVLSRQGEQLTVLDRCPAHLADGLDVVADDVAGQPPNRCTRRAGPSRGRGHEALGCRLEKSDDLLSLDGRETLEEVVNRLAGLEIVEKGLDGHPGAGEHRGSTHHVGVAGEDGGAHVGNVLRGPTACKLGGGG